MLRAALVSGCVALCSAAFAATPAPTVHTVRMEAMRFEPSSLVVTEGDVIVWVNRDLVPHTATSARKGGFDSGVVAAGKSWKYTVRTTGEFDYLCVLHPTMKGKLRVRSK